MAGTQTRSGGVLGPAGPAPDGIAVRVRHLLPAAVLAGAVLMLTPAAASAASTGAAPGTFGQHVRTCAQTMGLSGEHNPGLHHGAAGWDGMPCQ